MSGTYGEIRPWGGYINNLGCLVSNADFFLWGCGAQKEIARPGASVLPEDFLKRRILGSTPDSQKQTLLGDPGAFRVCSLEWRSAAPLKGNHKTSWGRASTWSCFRGRTKEGKF